LLLGILSGSFCVTIAEVEADLFCDGFLGVEMWDETECEEGVSVPLSVFLVVVCFVMLDEEEESAVKLWTFFVKLKLNGSTLSAEVFFLVGRGCDFVLGREDVVESNLVLVSLLVLLFLLSS